MSGPTEALFKPFASRNLSLPNRVVMAPMTRGFSPDGIPGDDVAAYYRRRAEGGVGLIITEGTTINHHAASQSDRHPAFYDAALPAWAKVVADVHKAGGKIVPQLWHVGMMRNQGRPKTDRLPAVGPSGLNVPGKIAGSPMTESDIADVIAAFVKAAVDAKEAGFDGVEFHGAHGYLIDQFFWAGTNVRDDSWGGDLVARTRFAAEIVKASRAAVGAQFPLILRFSQWKQQDFTQRLAQTPQELDAFLTPLVDAGVDIFHCSTRRFWDPEFDGSALNLAGWTKRITGLPTITVGSVGLSGSDFVASLGNGQTPEIANLDELLERLDRDEFDLVAIGRALIANPDWASRIRGTGGSAMKPFHKDMLSSLT